MLRNRSGSTLPTSLSYGDAQPAYGGAGNGYQQSSYGGYSGGGSSSSNGYGHTAAADTPMAFSDKPKRRSSSGLLAASSATMPSSLIAGSIALFFFMTTLYYRSTTNGILQGLQSPTKQAALDMVETLQRDVERYREQSKNHKRDAHDRYSNQITNLQDQKRKLQDERDVFKTKHQESKVVEKKVENLTARELAFQKQLAALQAATRKESRRSVLERFGPPPHKVEMQFVLPEDDTAQVHKFIIEMAHIDLVPHAIHLFLEQVAHGLWDHTYMYLNGPHVLQVGPQNMEYYHYVHDEDDDGRGPLLHAFAAKELKELAFPDYHPDFPHKTWTLGFSGRPGGPDFYINKVDNSKGHGPGGQSQHALHEQGDSCFGIITEGQEKLAMVYAQPTYDDRTEWHWFFEDPIEIIQARILNNIQPVPESQLTDQQPHHHPQHHDANQQTTIINDGAVNPDEWGRSAVEFHGEEYHEEHHEEHHDEHHDQHHDQHHDEHQGHHEENHHQNHHNEEHHEEKLRPKMPRGDDQVIP